MSAKSRRRVANKVLGSVYESSSNHLVTFLNALTVDGTLLYPMLHGGSFTLHSMALARMVWICWRTLSECAPRVTVTSLFFPQVSVTGSNFYAAFD